VEAVKNPMLAHWKVRKTAGLYENNEKALVGVYKKVEGFLKRAGKMAGANRWCSYWVT
jgi:hypothetical protein